MAKTTDLTNGNINKLLLGFAFPTLISNLFQQFYNLADTAIAGHILGDNALVAIGATSSLFSLIMTFANGLSGGFGIIIAREFGAKNESKVKSAVAHSLIINIIIGAVIFLLSLVVTKPILTAMNTHAAQFGDAYRYIIVILCTIAVPMIYNLEATILRSVGDSKTPLYFLIFASIMNIILDWVFMKNLNMGVTGAAVATVVSQLTASLLCLIVIKKNFPVLHITKSDFARDKKLTSDMLSAGMTMATMNSIFSIGSIIMQGAINALGETIIAAHLASRKLAEMFMQPLVTVGLACSTFVSQNFGAKKYDRISKAIRYSLIYCAVWSVISFFILWFLGAKATVLITGTGNAEVVRNTAMYLRINAPFYFVLGILFVLRFSIQSINRKIPPLISSAMELGTKTAAAFAFIPMWKYTGACIAEPLSWCMGAIYLSVVFASEMKKINQKSKA